MTSAANVSFSPLNYWIFVSSVIKILFTIINKKASLLFVCKIFTKCIVFSSSGQMASLEQVGEELVGQARCPFESGQSNVGLFAGKSEHH